MKKTLILDVDGVIVDLIGGILKKYNFIHNTNFKNRDINNYDLSLCLPEFSGDLLNDYDLYRYDCKFIEDEIPNYLTELQKLYNIYFVSSVPLVYTEAIKGRIDFFKEHLKTQSNNLENLILSGYKNFFFKGESVIVDDSPYNLYSTFHCVDNQILFRQPWNRDENFDGFDYVFDWTILKMYLEGLA